MELYIITSATRFDITVSLKIQLRPSRVIRLEGPRSFDVETQAIDSFMSNIYVPRVVVNFINSPLRFTGRMPSSSTGRIVCNARGWKKGRGPLSQELPRLHLADTVPMRHVRHAMLLPEDG